MSMIRASGAMPSMTAVQMATASLAVPKSVMKTMVGRVPDRETEAASLRVLEQAELIRASTSSRRANKRMREIINAPLAGQLLASQCKRAVDIGQVRF